MKFSYGGISMNVNIEATRKFQERIRKNPVHSCDCLYCQNYFAAIRLASHEERTFLLSYGVDPYYPLNVTCYYDDYSLGEKRFLYHVEALLVVREEIGLTQKRMIPAGEAHGMTFWVENVMTPSLNVLQNERRLPGRWCSLVYSIRLPIVMEALLS